eukprot:1155608-Pelagomonas_calceolata.AAC.1
MSLCFGASTSWLCHGQVLGLWIRLLCVCVTWPRSQVSRAQKRCDTAACSFCSYELCCVMLQVQPRML